MRKMIRWQLKVCDRLVDGKKFYILSTAATKKAATEIVRNWFRTWSEAEKKSQRFGFQVWRIDTMNHTMELVQEA